jgi:hypothetical protein
VGLASGRNIGQIAAMMEGGPIWIQKMPGLWHYDTCPISCTLIEVNFSVKYINDNNSKHLIASLKITYKLTEDWTGDLYCGIALNWDYVNRTVDISMPGYIKKKLQEYRHLVPN